MPDPATLQAVQELINAAQHSGGFDVWDAIQNLGLPTVLVIGLLWYIRTELKSQREREDRERDKQHATAMEREARLSTRLTQVEDFQRTELTTMNKAMVGAVTEHSQAMRELANVIERRDNVRLGA